MGPLEPAAAWGWGRQPGGGWPPGEPTARSRSRSVCWSPRLSRASSLLLAGYRPAELVLGRLVFLQAFAFLIAAVYSVLFAARSSAAAGPLILAVAVTALIGVPLGLALAALLPRELEGTLALIAIIGVQTSLPSNLAIAPALPFYGPIKLIQTSWNSHGAILPYFLHGLLAAGLLLALAMVLWSRGSAVRPLAGAGQVTSPR
jgi:hypothetical protein